MPLCIRAPAEQANNGDREWRALTGVDDIVNTTLLGDAGTGVLGGCWAPACPPSPSGASLRIRVETEMKRHADLSGHTLFIG